MRYSFGTTFTTRPHCFASSALSMAPVSTISIALYLPIARVSRWVPPAPGITPRLISGCPNFADSEARMISHVIASSQPPPSANPPTAAMIGFLIFRIRSQRANWSLCSISIADASAISLMSAPAAKTLSLPVRTIQRTSISLSSSSSAVTSSSINLILMAFRTSGRFS